jgi:hypothetical protein
MVGGRRVLGAVFERITDGTHAPTEDEIIEFVGKSAKGAWIRLRRFLEDNYDIAPEMLFDKKNGWNVRYRKSGKTLITLTPEKGAVEILMVLGRKESEEALSARTGLSHKMQELIENTRQLHDGRWLWIRLLQTAGAEDIEKLLPIKRKPRKRESDRFG